MMGSGGGAPSGTLRTNLIWLMAARSSTMPTEESALLTVMFSFTGISKGPGLVTAPLM